MIDRDPARVGLHRNVLDQLGMLIVSGSITPGEILLIEQLESRFAVSKSVIREAVRVLESMGLVSSRRRVGVTVLVREHWNVFDPRIIRWRLAGDDRDSQLRSLGGLRRGVEPVAAALAAQGATPEQCGELMRAVMEMAIHAKSGDLDAYLTADIAFHRTVLQASGNEMLRALAPLVAEVLTGRTRLHLMPPSPNPLAVRLHADVAQAIQGGDAAAAETAMRAIVEEATRAMLAGSDAPGPAGTNAPELNGTGDHRLAGGGDRDGPPPPFDGPHLRSDGPPPRPDGDPPARVGTSSL